MKSAVLSSTDGISHNEETTIDNQETASIRANSSSTSGGHKPLFEQLRANKDIQDAKDDEFQRSIRGMAALDDEDVAHLDAIEEQKREGEYKVKHGIEREVALFHAAREDRGLAQTVLEEEEVIEGGDDDHTNNRDKNKKAKGDDFSIKKAAVQANIPIVPRFTIKKKRKRVDAESKDKTAHQRKTDGDGEKKKQTESPPPGEEKPKSNNVTDLLGLGCYGSDSDSD